MALNYGITIAGTGSYLPSRILTNEDLERMVDTSDIWIQERTGIRERRLAADDETTSQMASQAGRRALEAAGMEPADLDLIVVATLTGDTSMPNTACYVQKLLGGPATASFSLEAACTGFLYAMQVAADMIRVGTFRNALVIGAEKLSHVTDWTDRNTCVLFGDGAGAAVLRACKPEDDSLQASYLQADGAYTHLLEIPAGGTAKPLTHAGLDARDNCIQMAGREVFKLALSGMVEASQKVLEASGLTVDDIRWLIPHQANLRIIRSVGSRLKMPTERVYINVDRFGNTSAATIPIALDEIVRGGLVACGDYLLLTAFGGGLTWGAQLIRW